MISAASATLRSKRSRQWPREVPIPVHPSPSPPLSLFSALVKTRHVALSSAADVAYFYASVSINFLR